jgi:hypothetical protein
MNRPIAAFVDPQAGHGHNPVVDLAHRAQILAAHMRGGSAVLAVAGIVDHKRAPIVRGGGGVIAQEPNPPVVDLLVVPGRFRQEELQPLDLAVLGADDRLGPGQPGQRLVAIPWQQQPLEVITEAAALGQAAKQGVKRCGVGLQWARCRRAGRRLVIGGGWLLAANRTMDRTAGAYPISTNYRLLSSKYLSDTGRGRYLQLCLPWASLQL